MLNGQIFPWHLPFAGTGAGRLQFAGLFTAKSDAQGKGWSWPDEFLWFILVSYLISLKTFQLLRG